MSVRAPILIALALSSCTASAPPPSPHEDRPPAPVASEELSPESQLEPLIDPGRTALGLRPAKGPFSNLGEYCKTHVLPYFDCELRKRGGQAALTLPKLGTVQIMEAGDGLGSYLGLEFVTPTGSYVSDDLAIDEARNSLIHTSILPLGPDAIRVEFIFERFETEWPTVHSIGRVVIECANGPGARPGCTQRE